MKFILAQPELKRFEWELEVLLTNLKKFGKYDVVLLFTKTTGLISEYLSTKYGCECHCYSERGDVSYIPSVKPWLLYNYFNEDSSRELESYFYIDSDVIFREIPDIENMTQKVNTWYGSDCSGYLSYDYILGCKNGEKIINDVSNIVGIYPEQIKSLGNNCIGAHVVMNCPSAEMWHKIYDDSNSIYKYFQTIDSNIQKWTAEMWSQLYNMILFNISPKTTEELSFSWATDDISKWYEHKIYHNAGVIDDKSGMFFKGKYSNRTPFRDDLSFVNKDKASIKYVEAIKDVINS